MSERQPGVFVSGFETDEWEHDDETGGLVHLLRADETVQAGLWKPGRMADEPIELALAADETFLVLAGRGELRVDSGDPLALERGVMVSLSKGAKTRWVVDAEFMEFWVYSGFD